VTANDLQKKKSRASLVINEGAMYQTTLMAGFSANLSAFEISYFHNLEDTP